MDDYAGRVLADRYRLPLPPSDEYELAETRAFDTYSGQEVLVRQVPLPEVVEAEVIDADGGATPRRASGREPRRPTDPAVRRAIEAAQSAAQIPDHPRLDQVFDVFAESGSLWIVSELITARPLAALLAERPLNPYRAAEIAADVLTAVRVLHGHGWTHRNITARTVLVCDDGRVVLTGLAAGAAEEALCGYAPVPVAPGVPGMPLPPEPAGEQPGASWEAGQDVAAEAPEPHAIQAPHESPASYEIPAPHEIPEAYGPGAQGAELQGSELQGSEQGEPGLPGLPRPERGQAGYGYGYGGTAAPEVPGQTAGVPYGGSSGTSGAMPRPQHGTPGIPAPFGGQPALPGGGSASGDIRAARAGAIAAYRAGARAAARVTEEQQRAADTGPVPLAVPRQPDGNGPGAAGPGATGPGAGAPGGNGPGGNGPGANGPGANAPGGGGPGQDWWAQPPRADDRHHAEDADAYADDDENDDDPPLPYRAELAGTWRDGPAPWNDSSGSVPAGGGNPYGPHAQGPFGTGGGTGQPGAAPHGPASGDGRDGTYGPGGDGPRRPAGGGRPALPAGGGGTPGAAMARSGDTPYTGPGSGSWHPSGARDALRADAQRHSPNLPAVSGQAVAGRWDDVVASGSVPAYRGPATPLAAERARQARIAIVGAVTERWAPEQAGPVHENWQLAPPIGPSTDLWALGALLYRAVQGHAPYPEESAAELVQLVVAEPPAFAEECGPLRPVVESLLRQDPTERPDFEELRGWLRSLVRSAPEPEAGLDVVQVPSVDGRLPIKRRRGELVRKRRSGLTGGRHRHKKGKERAAKDGGRSAVAAEQRHEPRQEEREARYESGGHRDERVENESYRTERQPFVRQQFDRQEYETEELYDRSSRSPRGPGNRTPRSLGRTLLILILLLLVAAIAFAVMFMPKADPQQGQSVGEATPTGSSAGSPPPGPRTSEPDKSGTEKADPPPKKPSAPPASGPAVNLAKGFALRQDPEGFRIAVGENWQRRPINDSGQVRYVGGDFTLIVVPGRDSVADNGADPMVYQRERERELQPFRDSSWSSASGLRRIDVGRQAMAEGQFTWTDNNGREVYVRNLAVVIAGRYHVIQVIGPDSQRDRVSEMYQQATSAYQVTD
ncbi:protein kinase [Streptomyces liangshanensis]|uniref:Protein kinase n=1 Tax=Streptomyces liangshanensis TaxID=2717324 RepID=A0A6G9GXV5_9ACTN|nr:protein kinase [Streptomyces liangshanensis]QIQ03112.1 protein kinase [Streptomyces liangshanensis]